MEHCFHRSAMLASSFLTNDKLQPPGFYIPVLRAESLIDVIVAVPTLYCILLHSPKNMTGLKWHMLNITVGVGGERHIQLTCWLGNLYMEYLFTPVPMFPTIAGFAAGQLSKVVPMHYLMVGARRKILLQIGSIIALYMAIASVTCAFVHRHNCIAECNKKWKLGAIQIRLAYVAVYLV